ncbi:MAG: class I SAM-dependent methyltransferase [Actinomycetota bacterium]|nr:class I SAM-dependent methyltransferase [Acidimicrobiia bacterium]MDQ3294866.1 class I SAM-dependent methyltransferase [Actinomycetota bacterium]
MPEPLATTADAAFAAVDGVDGWLSEGQVRRLFEATGAVPAGGRIVEIGSFRGRSTIVLGLAAGSDVEIVAIDPHAGNDRGPQEISGYEAEAADDRTTFLANLERAGVADRVRPVRKFSSDAHGDVADPIDLLWVDGAHRFGPARADLRDWGRRVRPGGALLVHDSWSSIGVTLALVVALASGRTWRYDGRVGSLASYTKVPGGVRSALRQLAELPWFARNVVKKVLITLKLRSGPWPY